MEEQAGAGVWRADPPDRRAQGEQPVGLLTEARGLLWSHSHAQSLPALGQISEVHRREGARGERGSPQCQRSAPGRKGPWYRLL